MRKDAAFRVFAKRLADIRLWGVVVALTVELARTGGLMPGQEEVGYGLVEQCALGVARVVEFGFGRYGGCMVQRLYVRGLRRTNVHPSSICDVRALPVQHGGTQVESLRHRIYAKFACSTV